ncbi:MAG: GAF domain-containing protein [Cyclobacteriaceae bacterium]|nr:GAF domain-containing protein [Cyclobacteriaceae bacterium]
MRYLILPLLLINLCPLIVCGQYHHFEKITETQGLSDNRVTSFLKDKNRFLWVGTANGLNRYDGYEFKIYKPGIPFRSISHEHINDIEQDNLGRLWIATWNGLTVLDPETDRIAFFTREKDVDYQEKGTIASSLVWDIYIDPDQKVWMALDARDLSVYDPKTKEFSYFPWREFVKKELPSRNQEQYTAIQKVLPRSDHQLWLGTTAGLFSFDIKTKQFEYIGGEDPVDFTAMAFDARRNVLFFTQNKPFAYDCNTKTLKDVILDRTNQIMMEPDASLIMPTTQRLISINQKTLHAIPLATEKEDPFSIHLNSIKVVYKDPDGTTWIGTSEGIRKYDSRLDVFRYVKIYPDSIRPVTGNLFHITDSKQDEKFYVSSYAGNKLLVIDKRNGALEQYPSALGIPLTKCSQTFEDSKGNFWVLTYKNIFLFDRLTKKFTMFPYPDKNMDTSFIEMIEDAEGNFWFASLHNGLFFFNSKTKTWSNPNAKEEFFGRRVTSLLSDPSHNAVWIGEFGFGVYRYDLKKKEFSHFNADVSNINSLHSSLINDLTQDLNGDIWIATNSGGVSKFRYGTKPDEEFISFSIENGLPENTINAIETDSHGNLWLASFKGLTTIKTSGEVIKHYDASNGLPFSNYSNPLSKSSGGELMSGIANGFIRFNPDSLSISTAGFPVVITSLLVGDSMLNTHTSHLFTHHQNDITFQFSALTYSLPQKVNYYYQLEGYDKQWINSGNGHIAKYTNLNNGSYTFKIRATDHSGRTSANIASINFVIDPPFWETWWFILIMSLLVLSSLMLWIRSLQRKVVAQKILKQVATSMYNQKTIDQVFTTVVNHCIDLLHFQNCKAYILSEEENKLILKSSGGLSIDGTTQKGLFVEIPVGTGIIGKAAQTGNASVQYVQVDGKKFSEIAIPVIVENRVFAVIQSEHISRNFFSSWHLNMLKEIAAICGAKIGRYFIEDQIRSKVARDLHDDMGSTLSSINIMSRIALEKNEPLISQKYLKNIRENASVIQESMSDIVWAINPENDTMSKVILRMKEFTTEILEPLDIQYEFLQLGDFNDIKMDLGTRKDFYLIFKEAVNNAAKYSQGKKITISLNNEGKSIYLEVKDDGQGFAIINHEKGNGLKNMKHRAHNIKASLEIDSKPGNGTIVLLKVPIT